MTTNTEDSHDTSRAKFHLNWCDNKTLESLNSLFNYDKNSFFTFCKFIKAESIFYIATPSFQRIFTECKSLVKQEPLRGYAFSNKQVYFSEYESDPDLHPKDQPQQNKKKLLILSEETLLRTLCACVCHSQFRSDSLDTPRFLIRALTLSGAIKMEDDKKKKKKKKNGNDLTWVTRYANSSVFTSIGNNTDEDSGSAMNKEDETEDDEDKSSKFVLKMKEAKRLFCLTQCSLFLAIKGVLEETESDISMDVAIDAALFFSTCNTRSIRVEEDSDFISFHSRNTRTLDSIEKLCRSVLGTVTSFSNPKDAFASMITKKDTPIIGQYSSAFKPGNGFMENYLSGITREFTQNRYFVHFTKINMVEEKTMVTRLKKGNLYYSIMRLEDWKSNSDDMVIASFTQSSFCDVAISLENAMLQQDKLNGKKKRYRGGGEEEEENVFARQTKRSDFLLLRGHEGVSYLVATPESYRFLWASLFYGYMTNRVKVAGIGKFYDPIGVLMRWYMRGTDQELYLFVRVFLKRLCNMKNYRHYNVITDSSETCSNYYRLLHGILESIFDSTQEMIDTIRLTWYWITHEKFYLRSKEADSDGRYRVIGLAPIPVPRQPNASVLSGIELGEKGIDLSVPFFIHPPFLCAIKSFLEAEEVHYIDTQTETLLYRFLTATSTRARAHAEVIQVLMNTVKVPDMGKIRKDVKIIPLRIHGDTRSGHTLLYQTCMAKDIDIRLRRTLFLSIFTEHQLDFASSVKRSKVDKNRILNSPLVSNPPPSIYTSPYDQLKIPCRNNRGLEMLFQLLVILDRSLDSPAPLMDKKDGEIFPPKVSKRSDSSSLKMENDSDMSRAKFSCSVTGDREVVSSVCENLTQNSVAFPLYEQKNGTTIYETEVLPLIETKFSHSPKSPFYQTQDSLLADALSSDTSFYWERALREKVKISSKVLRPVKPPKRPIDPTYLIAACRVCTTQDREDNPMLIDACECKFSLRYIHYSCLRAWASSSKDFRACNSCLICKKNYRFIFQESLPLHMRELVQELKDGFKKRKGIVIDFPIDAVPVERDVKVRCSCCKKDHGLFTWAYANGARYDFHSQECLDVGTAWLNSLFGFKSITYCGKVASTDQRMSKRQKISESSLK